ncbi:unnamed protein product, partial [Phaeothamnion confervicola]
EERRRQAAECKSLRAKLEWYTENQELLDQNALKVTEQAREIDTLKRTLREYGRAPAGGGGGGGGSNDARRVKELEAQLKELEEALRKRNPDCLANLVRAARPSESLEARARESDRRVALLEVEVERTKHDAEVKLRTLRQQHDRVRLGYQKRLEE